MVRDGHRERAARERLSRASRCACRRDVGGADLSFTKTNLAVCLVPVVSHDRIDGQCLRFAT